MDAFVGGDPLAAQPLLQHVHHLAAQVEVQKARAHAGAAAAVVHAHGARHGTAEARRRAPLVCCAVLWFPSRGYPWRRAGATRAEVQARYAISAHLPDRY